MIEKIKNLFKRAIEAFKRLFKKEATPTPTKPTESTGDPSKPDFGPKPPISVPPTIDFSKYKGLTITEVILKIGRGLTVREKQAAMEAGVIFPEAAKPPQPVDRSGTDLGTGSGFYKVNPIKYKVPLVFDFEVPQGSKLQRFGIFGTPSAFFDQVWVSVGTLEQTRYSGNMGQTFDFKLPEGKHKLTVTVNGDGDLGVQYQQY